MRTESLLKSPRIWNLSILKFISEKMQVLLQKNVELSKKLLQASTVVKFRIDF